MRNENDKLIEAFSKSLPEYLRDVETTSGKLFYSITWSQMEEHLPEDHSLNILDMGCGFGLTSIWLSEHGHHVIGIDITPDMIQAAEQKAKEKQQKITFLQGDLDSVVELLNGKTMDWIICHNVLGYLEQPKEAIEKLGTLLNPEGYLSIVVHNPVAKVLRKSIVEKNVKDAEEIINQEKVFNPLIGAHVHQYSMATYLEWFEKLGFEMIEHYGIRCVFDYMQQSEEEKVKSTSLQDLLDLERKLGKLTPYRDIAFFYHFIVQKR